MKSATPSGNPREPSVVDAKELEEWRRGYGDPRRKTPGETDGARGRGKYEKGEKPSWLLSPQEKWERDNPEAVRQHKKEFGLDEDCGPMGHEGGEAIDINGPGAEVHVDDISNLSPEEAFAAGMAAAKDAIDQALGGDVPPEGEGALEENNKPSITLDEARDVARKIFERIKEIK